MSNRRFMLVIVLMATLFLGIKCAGPLYSNKKARIEMSPPMVYLVPSATYGRFHYVIREDKTDPKTAVIAKSITFDEWEYLDYGIDLVFRDKFREQGATVTILKQVDEPMINFIQRDTIKQYHLDHLSLNDVYKDGFKNKFTDIKCGILVAFTKLTLVRVFPNIKVTAKYYAYDLTSGDLIYANTLKEKYMMAGVTEGYFRDYFGNTEKKDVWDRFFGLWLDERDVYLNIVSMVAKDISKAIISKCVQ